MTPIEFVQIGSTTRADAYYQFNVIGTSYYRFDDIFTPDSVDSEFLTEYFTINVYTQLETDRSFNDDIVCENCSDASAPYFWLNDYYGMHSCLSHLPDATQAFILDHIATLS